MNRTVFTFTCMFMTFAGLLFLGEVKGTLNGSREHKQMAEFWKSKVAREQLKKLLVQGHFADFKQDIALLIPQEIENRKVEEEKQQLRNLASVIPHEGTHEIQLGLSAKKMLLDGKEKVKKREFKEATQILKRLVDTYPDSYHIIEAHYLIIEAYAQQDKNANVITWVEKMVDLFPENRLTGYALLKIGGLYELDGRVEDAVRIYKTIVAVYEDKKLVSQAQVAVSELQL